MSRKRSYLAAAFNARPFGMPIPPNWFGIAAFAVLGAFINPGLWLIGLGLEGLYLWTLSQHPRFRATVDAQSPERVSWDSRYQSLVATLDVEAREQQGAIEHQAAEIVDLLTRNGEQFAGFLESRSEVELSEMFTSPMSSGQPAMKSGLELLLGAKEHEMHHRAQLMLIERQLGIIPHLTRQMNAMMEQTRPKERPVGA